MFDERNRWSRKIEWREKTGAAIRAIKESRVVRTKFYGQIEWLWPWEYLLWENRGSILEHSGETMAKLQCGK
jgi:hypothetical protein